MNSEQTPRKSNIVVLLSKHQRKLEEWRACLSQYGLKVHQSLEERSDADIFRILENSGALCACVDWSDLFDVNDETQPVEKLHLQSCVHICRITCYSLVDGQLTKAEYAGSKQGYLDLLNGGYTADGWWDSAFIIRDAHCTYHEQSPKRSARDEALSGLIAAMLTDKHVENETDSKAFSAVSFDVPFSDEVLSNPNFQNSSAAEMGLDGILTASLNLGLFRKRGQTRPQRHFWEPNFAGVPEVKKGDPIRDAKFGFHDLVHMIIGEALIFDEKDWLSRQIYLTYRMCSEAFTLLIADGLFAESLRRTTSTDAGGDYDFSERTAFPFLVEDLGLKNRSIAPEELRELLHANAQMFLLGSTAPFIEKIRALGVPDSNFKKYFQKFGRYAVTDWKWTHHNYQQMICQRGPRRQWWNSVSGIVQSCPELGLTTVADIRALLPANLEHAKGGEDLQQLVRMIVDIIFANKILPYYQKDVLAVDKEVERSRAATRWLIGQMYLFEVFADVPTASTLRDLIADTLIEYKDRLSAGLIRNIRERIEDFLALLQKLGRISDSERKMWANTFPHFGARYLNYNDHEDLTKVSQSLLLPNMRTPEPDDIAPGTVAIITDGYRFILQRKDDAHPNPKCRGKLSLFGGSCDRTQVPWNGELSWVGLNREFEEEFGQNVHELYLMSRSWNTFVLSGNQQPGNYALHVYEIRLTADEFTAWQKRLEACQITEGTMEVLTRNQLSSELADTNNFVCSLDVPIRNYLALA